MSVSPHSQHFHGGKKKMVSEDLVFAAALGCLIGLLVPRGKCKRCVEKVLNNNEQHSSESVH